VTLMGCLYRGLEEEEEEELCLRKGACQADFECCRAHGTAASRRRTYDLALV